jgi:DNA adenine methylase
MKPPLKWAGGKRWLLPYLESLWREHAHRRLVEPFCGGLAVALGLGATVDDLALVHHVYPSISEGLKAAAERALPTPVRAARSG